jgi:hypothetical protein
MRWDALFADLEAAAAGEWLRERDSEIAERTRAELARLRLVDRLRAYVDRRPSGGGRELAVRVWVAGVLRGEVTRVAQDWFVLVTRTHEWVVAVDAVVGISGLPPAARPPDSRVAVSGSLSWAAAWRVLARDRTPVQVVRRDGSTVAGTPGRVGQDFVELSDAEAEVGAGWSGSAYEVVPHAVVAAVRCPRELVPGG